MELTNLPEGCISTILSLTSPLDVCKSSLVSTSFLSAADSDIVWESFLPSDYHDIVKKSTTRLRFCSKKELFRRLCDAVYLDCGRKMFKLEKLSGKKSYIISARDLDITWSNQSMYWNWVSLPESRFSEAASLRTTCWLEIQAKLKTKMLSEKTLYAAFLILKISDRAYGLDLTPSEVSVEVGNQITSSGTACLRRREDSIKQQMELLMFGNRTHMLAAKGDGRVPVERDDGWSEIELGEFFVDGGSNEEVKMSLKEVKGQHLKGGLIVEGIEIRPKY